MPSSYERYQRQQRRSYGASTGRSTLGYWVPLAVTVTVATVGLAAWIWSERKDHDEDDDDDRKGGPGPARDYGELPDVREAEGPRMQDNTFTSRVSEVYRRTPSPQQLFGSASKRVSAGVAAAGAAVGGALSSIREEDKPDFEDHTRWSEEAESRSGTARIQEQRQSRSEIGTPTARQGSISGNKGAGKRKTVAIVISAEDDHDHTEEVSYLREHASVLSHLPHHMDAQTRVFILIYAPELKQHPMASQSGEVAPSITSSYSNIGPEDVPPEKPLSAVEPAPMSPQSPSRKFNALYREAQVLVEKETMIIPFTTSTGYVHILRNLGPEIVYLQETLSGLGGEIISDISPKWVGQVILVVGDESGHGGLVDSEDERRHLGEEKRENWWQDDPRIGLGKGVEVVEGLMISEDFRRRVGGHD